MTDTTISHADTSNVGGDTISAHDHATSEVRLRRVLLLNGLNSLVFGVVLAAAPEAVDRILDTGHPGWVRLVGLGLLPFAGAWAWLSKQPLGTLRKYTPVTVAGDMGWVVASVVTVLLGWYSTSGLIVVLAVAALVDLFAVLQWTAWRNLRVTR